MDCTCQAPLSVGFPRQEYWSGLPFLSPGYLPNLGIEPRSPTLQVVSLLSEPPGKSCCYMVKCEPFIAMLNVGGHLPLGRGRSTCQLHSFQSSRKSMGIRMEWVTQVCAHWVVSLRQLVVCYNLWFSIWNIYSNDLVFYDIVPLEEGVQPTPVFLPGESHGQRSLAGFGPWGRKESDMA